MKKKKKKKHSHKFDDENDIGVLLTHWKKNTHTIIMMKTILVYF